MRQARLCRWEAFYGDPNASDIPLETLLSGEYASERIKAVRDMASLELVPSHLEGAAARLRIIAARAGTETPIGPGGGEVTFAAVPEIEGDTVHLDVVDRFGNMVSATPSGGWLQSSPVVLGLGFSISKRAQMFWLDEGLPSSLRPSTRPRTTLTPTLVSRDGDPYLAIGTPGGDQQDQWSLTVFLRSVTHGYGLQRSIDAPMFHSRHWPTSFYPRDHELGRLLIEARFSDAVIDRLRQRGTGCPCRTRGLLGVFALSDVMVQHSLPVQLRAIFKATLLCVEARASGYPFPR